jgi:hypothetical protein
MANRYTNQFRAQLEKRVSSIFAHVSFGAAGAPTLDVPNSKGVVSITRDSAGVYTIVFGTQARMLDTYVKLLSVSKAMLVASSADDRQMSVLSNDVSDSALCSIQVAFHVAGVDTDPANGSEVFVEIVMGDSTAP